MSDLIDKRDITVDVFAIVHEPLGGAIRLVKLYKAGRRRHGGSMLYYCATQIDTHIPGVTYTYDDETNATHMEFWGGLEDRIVARYATAAEAFEALQDGMDARAEVQALVKGAETMLKGLVKLRDQRFKDIVQAKERVERDGCEVCNGARGGVKGNENVVDGKVVCDYCHVDIMDARKS